MEVKELQSRIEGRVTTTTDAGYENLRCELIWNQLTPARYPQMVVQVATEQDVVETVRFARATGLKIAVRGGGHSWVGFALRDDSLLIDLGHLTQVAIDRAARTAVIQPAISGRDLNRQLAAQGLAFPVGHCPTVSLSGFLLNGGLGWNFNSWKPACFSITAANVVTADGNLVVANEQQNADLLWAIRGAGPGFFGIVTQYELKLYPVPGAITTSNYYYPLQHATEVGAWAASIAGRLSKEVELTIFFAPAPPLLRSAAGQLTVLCVSSVRPHSLTPKTKPLQRSVSWRAVRSLTRACKRNCTCPPQLMLCSIWAACCGRSVTGTWPTRSGRTRRLPLCSGRYGSISCGRRQRSHWQCWYFLLERRTMQLRCPTRRSR